MSTTSERLRKALSLRNMKQSELAARTGIGKSSISMYLSGAYLPKQQNIYKMARVLDVDEAWLMGIDVPMERTSPSTDLPSNMYPLPEMEKIPLVGSIACGTPILAEENIEAYVDLPRHIRADYALECKGDSMVGVDINDGDIVYIRKQPNVENGQIAAVRIGDEATLKRVYYDGECLQLVAENPKIRPMVFFGEEMNDIVIEGLAVAHCRSLRGI
ncbi:MAG: S24 family peptidase [Eubacteriales bacterium]|nr:S24 family peptidase [Eubacteriales bacterium]